MRVCFLPFVFESRCVSNIMLLFSFLFSCFLFLSIVHLQCVVWVRVSGCSLSDSLLLIVLFPPHFFFILVHRLKAELQYYRIMLEMLPDGVQLSQLPLLLLLKFHVHKMRVVRGLLLLFVIVCRMAQRISSCGLTHLIPVPFLFTQTRCVFNVPLGSAVICTASIYL